MPGRWPPERPGVVESSAYFCCRSLLASTGRCSARPACGRKPCHMNRQGAVHADRHLKEGVMVAAEAEEATGEGVAEGKRAVERLPSAYLPVSSSGGTAHAQPLASLHIQLMHQNLRMRPAIRSLQR